MITKPYRNMLNEFVKRANKKMSYFASQKIELTWYEQSNSCYVCDLKHYNLLLEDLKSVDAIVMYIVGVGMGLDEDLISIWRDMVRFDHIINKRL
jgi:hypothetical protein